MPRTGSSFGVVIRWVSAGLLFALLVLFVTGGMLIISLFEMIAHATIGMLGGDYTTPTHAIAPNLWNVPSHEAIISLCLYALFITVYAIAFVVSLVLFLQNRKRGMYR